MVDHVVVDVEIQKTIEELPGGWQDTDKMGVAAAVVYEFASDRYRIFGPDDVPALRERLEAADLISGFNIWAFDFPVIWGQPRAWRNTARAIKTNDILRRIWQSLGLDPEVFTSAHKGYSLDNICKDTFGYGKIGNGADAPKWFQAGQHHRVVNYCIDDVALERDLTMFVEKHGFILCQGKVVFIDDFKGA